ncbi:MAG: bacteriohemerythrin [Beijerinckiaceae bacterium]
MDDRHGIARPGERARVFVDRHGSADMCAAERGSSVIRLVWQEEYECGEPTIDREHQELFDLANSLFEASFKSESSPQAVSAVFEKLMAHIVRHFADEEALLARYGYKDLEPHRLAHTGLLARATELEASVAAGKTTLGDLVEFFANTVIAQHLFKADRAFLPLFRKRECHAMQRDLAGAINRNELLLYYQPQAQIGGEIFGFEALVRWCHQERGMVYPDVFIPLAEENGLILQIGEWVLREACREAASWPNPLTVAVNLSPVQFRHNDLVGLVHAVLLETGLAPHRLELEITEGVMLNDQSRALAIVRRIKDLGVRIAIDDFGTGYCSLSYLQFFPFDKIKIDRSFICNLGRYAQSRAIIRAIVGLGRDLQIPIIAEGIETEDQLAFLRRESCGEIQGYLLGRPRPIADYATTVGRLTAEESDHRAA